MEIKESSKGKLLIEGKTKKVFELKENSDLVLIESKDRITAGDGVKSHEMKGKSQLSTQTNCALFEFLNKTGIQTHFVSRVNNSSQSFVAKKCSMIPIEWVSRRIASGSYLKRHPNVKEGHVFTPVKLEQFFKDDANHDPFWSEESIVSAKLKIGGILIEEKQLKVMLELSRLVFELLERIWETLDHTLVDMKIEFGIDSLSGDILVSDVIDNDSWRLWPKGLKSLMLDKQLYRDLKQVSEKDLQNVKESFEIVAKRTQELFSSLENANQSSIGIIFGSKSDLNFAEKISKELKEKYLIRNVFLELSSAHKSTKKTLELISKFEQNRDIKALICLAGLSNGLGPVCASNTTIPVINCPPIKDPQTLSLDIWSSIRMPSGVGVSTVLGEENAALNASLIVGNDNPLVWSRVRTQQTLQRIKLILN